MKNSGRSGAMIGVARENGAGAVELFEQHDAYQLVRPRGGAESEPDLGAIEEAGRNAISASNDEAHSRTVFGSPLAQQACERRAVEALATLVENNDDCSIGYDIGERDRLLDTPAFGILRAAFANLNDFDVA
jgi:hypothetical protein